MSRVEQFREVIDHYRRFNWALVSVLVTLPTLRAAGENPPWENVKVKEGEIDAAWFSRSSGEGREAWELRLVGETPYALFETFEADESEEDRDDVRTEME